VCTVGELLSFCGYKLFLKHLNIKSIGNFLKKIQDGGFEKAVKTGFSHKFLKIWIFQKVVLCFVRYSNTNKSWKTIFEIIQNSVVNQVGGFR
jgi:hypothetical protein